MPSKYQTWILAVSAILLFSLTLSHGYVYDDEIVILKNTHVQEGLKGIPAIWTHNYLNGVSNYNDGLYRPLSPTMFAFEQALFGNNPFIGHLINILLYAAIGLILFLLVKALTQSHLLAFISSLIFIVHPIHTEVIANIKSRDELLAALFGFSALWWVVKYPVLTIKNGTVVIGCFLLAMLSKESAVAFAVVIPLFYWFKHGKLTKELGGLAACLAVVSITWYAYHHSVIASMPTEVDQGLFSGISNAVLMADNFGDRLATGLWITGMYLYKCLVPYPLVSDYSPGVIEVVSFFSIKNIFSLLVLCIVFGLGAWLLIKRNLIGLGIITFFILLAPVSNVFLPIGTTLGERLAFAPSFGIVLALGALLVQWKWNKKYHLAGACMLVLAVLSVNRASEWESNLTLFEADVKKHPESYRTHYNYASALSKTIDETKPVTSKDKQLLDKSIHHFEQALKIRPDYADAYNNLANAYRRNRDFNQAVKLYTDLIKKDPDYSKAYYNLAITHYETANYQKAHKAFHQYIEVGGSQEPAAWYFAGLCSGFTEDFQQAIEELKQSTELDPYKWDAWNMMGMAYGNLNEWEEAVQAFQRAYTLSKDQSVLENLNKAKINKNTIASL